MKIDVFVPNIVEVIRSLFPGATNGEDFNVLDDGMGGMEVVTSQELPDVKALLQVSADLALHAEKARANTRIADYSRAKRSLIAGTTDDAEIAGWSNKLRIAEAILAGTAIDREIEVFKTEVALRGIEGESIELFTKKVIRNAAFFGHAVALIDGLKRKAQDSVAAAQSLEEVAAVIEAMRAQAEAAFESLMQGTQ